MLIHAFLFHCPLMVIRYRADIAFFHLSGKAFRRKPLHRCSRIPSDVFTLKTKGPRQCKEQRLIRFI